MKRTCDITRRGDLRKLIQDVEKYRDGLDDKCREYIIRLADVGIKAVSASLGSISPIYKGNTSVSLGDGVIKIGNGYKAVIKMSGDQALFIEFGAGVTFNTQKGDSLHPKGKELGMTIGSYNPDSPNATNPYGWWYIDEWGEKQHTYGTPTFAPLYNSYLEMRSVMMSIAKEVFK